MRADWVDKNPKATLALLMAVQEAQMWCDKVENRTELAQIVSKRAWFNVPETDIVLKVTVSIGVSVFRGNRREFFNAADRALYQSKAAGKNCVHYALS